MRHAFDTNVLAYAAGLGGTESDIAKQATAQALLRDVLRHDRLVIPLQVALELRHLLTRKGGLSGETAAATVRGYLKSALPVATDLAVVDAAFDLSARHRMQIYDAVILAAAARGGCNLLYSEDMQNGFVWNGVTVIDPFG